MNDVLKDHLKDHTLLIEDFINAHNDIIFDTIVKNTDWDESISARKTASYGKPYNYSQITYPYKEFTSGLSLIIDKIETVIGFKPNNCLINYYTDGKSKMGYHSDQTDILEPDTGVVIISLGETRCLKFRDIGKTYYKEFDLVSGSLFFMTAKLQEKFQHSITKSNTDNGRMSLTFRKLKE